MLYGCCVERENVDIDLEQFNLFWVVSPIKIPLNCTVNELIIRQNYELCHKLIKYPQRQYIFINDTQ